MTTKRLLLVLLALTVSAGIAQEREFKPDKQIVYKQFDKDPLELNVFLPDDWKASDRRPAIVFFFGGGWVGGTPTQFYPHSRYLASRGMGGGQRQYRTRSSHGTSPVECVADGKSAVRWMREHAAELGIDPDSIAAGGGSAGGHVAATTGVIDGLDEPEKTPPSVSVPNALVLFNPATDISKSQRWGDRAMEGSPLHHVDRGDPQRLSSTAGLTRPCLTQRRCGSARRCRRRATNASCWLRRTSARLLQLHT